MLKKEKSKDKKLNRCSVKEVLHSEDKDTVRSLEKWQETKVKSSLDQSKLSSVGMSQFKDKHSIYQSQPKTNLALDFSQT